MRMRDPDSFDVFYAGCVRRVTSHLYAIIGDLTEAEDAVQEAFARAWLRWGKISGYADPEGWVRTVSYRITVSAWRKRRNAAVAHRRYGPAADLPDLNPDSVCEMQPAPGARVPAGSTVVLYVVSQRRH
jgi:RNA polymerase sigma-70 factor (ECF subfamily)